MIGLAALLALALSGADLPVDSCSPPKGWTDPAATRHPTTDPVRADLRRDLDSIYRSEERLAEWKCQEVWSLRDTTTESDTTASLEGLEKALAMVGNFLDANAEAIRWLFVGGAAFLIGWIAWKYRDMVDFSGGRPSAPVDPPSEPTSRPVVREPPLPDDPTDSVMDLWNRAQRRQALSLLYRHACRFAASRGAVLRQGAAEGSLGREVRDLLRSGRIHPQQCGLLESTIRTWSRAAWADQWPDTETVAELCRQWRELRLDGGDA